MSLDNLINRMSKSKYTFKGAYFTSDSSVVHRGGRPMQLQFECFQTAESIRIEGGCFRPGNAPPYAFTLEIPFTKITFGSAVANIRCPDFGELEGLLVFTVDGFELIAQSSLGQAGSLHFHYFTESDFSVTGLLMLNARSIAFSARETGQWENFTQAKVLSLGKRA